MSKLIEKYKELLNKLFSIREEHEGEDSSWYDIREDETLDQMDDVWWEMSDAERQEFDSGCPTVSTDKQKAERLLSYIGDFSAAGIYIEPFKYNDAISEELRRGVMRMRVGNNPGEFSYEGFDIGFSGSRVLQQISFTDENAKVLLPLLREIARKKAYSILKEEEETTFQFRALEIVEKIEG